MSQGKTKVYIYTRVSTTMQIDDYSLDAQKARMKAYADFNNYQIVGEYEDAGKSGKSIEGRASFCKMMDDIKSGKDGVAYVLVFSHIISLNHDRMHSFAGGVLPFGLILGVVTVLMLLEPHLSGTLLILGIGAVLMFVGGTGLKWFVLAGVSGVAAIGAAVVIMPDLVPYAADRLNSWLDPFADPLGDGHQTIQSLYAIGSGGAAGLGLGNSRQKHLFVPEPQNDFIFSIVCEELGFVGACAVVGLFVLLLWRGITLAAHAPDRFGALLVVGFTVQVALQAVLNMAVVTNTIPNTGISLPFFSSGGTSLMMLLGEMGVVLSVSRGET